MMRGKAKKMPPNMANPAQKRAAAGSLNVVRKASMQAGKKLAGMNKAC